MNDLSSTIQTESSHCCCCCCCCCYYRSFTKTIPSPALYILTSLFLIGLSLSIFILIAVHNAILLLSLLLLASLVLVFLLWNARNYTTNASILLFLHSFPDSDLRVARHGQLVKITGPVSCGNICLESSYEKANRCIYTSTLLYEYGEFGLKQANVKKSCFGWSLAYSERFSTDFLVTDNKSGIRAIVKAGSGSKVIPLVVESILVNTSGKCKILSSNFRSWLRDRNLSAEARLLRLEEGYIKEGSYVSVIGMLIRSHDSVMIVQPPELIYTGCLWRKLLLPADVDGLVLGVTEMASTVTNSSSVQHPE